MQVSEIAYLCRKGKATLLRAHDGRVFIFWESLDKVEKQLDPAHFYRASKTYIIPRNAVRSWQRQPDRGILLEVQPQDGEPFKISRDKAGEIIAWIKKAVSTTVDSALS